MEDVMTLAEAKEKLRVEKDIELAQALGVTQQAVSLWRNTGKIPLLRQYQIREKINAV
jgi:hypothetical protein